MSVRRAEGRGMVPGTLLLLLFHNLCVDAVPLRAAVGAGLRAAARLAAAWLAAAGACRARRAIERLRRLVLRGVQRVHLPLHVLDVVFLDRLAQLLDSRLDRLLVRRRQL